MQGSALETEVQRRVKESYGERETVTRAVQRLLTSFSKWELLKSNGKPKVYERHKRITIDDESLRIWLVEVFLYSSSSASKNVQNISSNPIFFPFDLGDLNTNELSKSSRLEIINHSLDEKLVMLCQKN